MSGQGAGQFLVYAGVLLLLGYPLGLWLAKVFGSFRAPGIVGATERGFDRLLRRASSATSGSTSTARSSMSCSRRRSS